MKLFSYIFVIAVILIGLSGCEDKNFYNDNIEDRNNPDSQAKLIDFKMNVDNFICNGIISGEVIIVKIPYGTVIGSYSPVIEISSGATIDPASGIEVNFTNPVVYTVTSKDGTVENQYNIITAETPNDEADITRLTMNINSTDYTGNIDGTNITVTAPYGTTVGSYSPVIEISAGATIDPLGGISQDFSGGPVIYTVTAHDGITSINYNVSVIEAPNNEAFITGLTVNIAGNDYTGDISGTDITVDVPYSTIISQHSPVIQISAGAAVTPLSGVEVDFSAGAVVYTVTAEDGTTTTNYNVTINELPFDPVWHGDYTITNQSHIDALLNKTTIDGSLTVNSIFLTDLTGLESLTTINGSLIINNTMNLENLKGLGSLNYIGGQLYINNNSDLSLIERLEFVTYIGTHIQIYNNPVLDALTALDNVTSISGGIAVTDNPSLQSLGFMSKITTCKSVYINRNHGMGNIGLQLLKTVNGDFRIINNDNINRIYILALETVDGDFEVTYNDDLRHQYPQEVLVGLTTFGGIAYIFGNNND